jgi:hypothetical protein
MLRCFAQLTPTPADRPRPLRDVVVAPHGAHAAAAAVFLVVSLPLVGSKATLLVVLELAALLAWLLYPLWGGTRLSFEGGVFRVAARRSRTAALELAVGELRAFEAVPTDRGFCVFAVKTDGMRLALALDLANPFHALKGDDPAWRRNDREEEATRIAERLSELLLEARGGYGTYR